MQLTDRDDMGQVYGFKCMLIAVYVEPQSSSPVGFRVLLPVCSVFDATRKMAKHFQEVTIS